MSKTFTFDSFCPGSPDWNLLCLSISIFYLFLQTVKRNDTSSAVAVRKLYCVNWFSFVIVSTPATPTPRAPRQYL